MDYINLTDDIWILKINETLVEVNKSIEHIFLK